MSTKVRERNPRGHGERLREALLDAATELLAELGDQNKLSIRSVTARAGVTPTAIYLHFADKDALLSALMLRGYARLRASVHAGLEDAPNADPREQLGVFGNAYVEFALSNAGLYRVLFMTTVRDGVPMPSPDGTDSSDEGVAAFYDLTRIVALVHPDPGDAFAHASYLWASLHGYVALRITLSALPLPGSSDYVERIVQAFIGA